MPTYCYTTDDGKTEERVFSSERIPRRIKIDGQWARRDRDAEHRQYAHVGATYPMISTACGVHPSQRFDAMREAEIEGVPTYFNEEGDAVITSRGHRRRLARMLGLHAKNAGYSDPVPD